jgi:DNA-binding NarL/FixJ family response regulator
MARFTLPVQYDDADGPPPAANLNHSRNRSLTDPEAHVLLLLKAGKEKTEIAADVGADEAAVKEHIKAILRKAVAAHGQGHDPKRTICLVPEASRPGVEQ